MIFGLLLFSTPFGNILFLWKVTGKTLKEKLYNNFSQIPNWLAQQLILKIKDSSTERDHANLRRQKHAFNVPFFPFLRNSETADPTLKL